MSVKYPPSKNTEAFLAKHGIPEVPLVFGFSSKFQPMSIL